MMDQKNCPLLIFIAEKIYKRIKIKKLEDTAQQYIRKNSLLINKETVSVFEMYTCVKKV